MTESVTTLAEIVDGAIIFADSTDSECILHVHRRDCGDFEHTFDQMECSCHPICAVVRPGDRKFAVIERIYWNLGC